MRCRKRRRPSRFSAEAPSGCEFAQVMSRLGVSVNLLELLPRLLPRDDEDASALIRSRFTAEGINVLTGTKATAFSMRGEHVVATVEENGQSREIESEALLLATGRSPNVHGLGLEEAGVEFDRRGVTVDETLTTSQRHIFACGDVAGPYQFTHTADYQARIVIRNILIPWFKAKANYTWVPWVTYTDPEIAHCGLTEDEAKKKDVSYDVFRYDWEDLDRAITDSETTGFIKVLTAKGQGHDSRRHRGRRARGRGHARSARRGEAWDWAFEALGNHSRIPYALLFRAAGGGLVSKNEAHAGGRQGVPGGSIEGDVADDGETLH